MKRLVLPPLIAHVLAWAAFFGVVLWPFGYDGSTMSTSADGLTITASFGWAPGPFRRYLGFEEIMLLLIPVALTGLAIWLAWPRRTRSTWTRPALWGLGVLCLVYCSAPIWFIEVGIGFIGGFFVPAAVALVVSVIIVSMSKPTLDAAS